MKTVFYSNVDGYDICLGVSDAIVDPVATSIVIAEDLHGSAEAKAIAALDAQVDALKQAQRFASSQAVANQLQVQIDELAQGYPALSTALNARRSALMGAKAVYFNPGSGEGLVTDDQATALLAAQAPNLKVKLDGITIADFRGASYWQQDTKTGRWANTMITRLGDTVPAGVTLDAALTDADKQQIAAQFEAERVAALSAEQQQAEADAQQQALLAQAALMQSELEVQDDPDALSKAQAWYSSQTATVAAKYKVAGVATIAAAK
jgi:hypothetical protein